MVCYSSIDAFCCHPLLALNPRSVCLEAHKSGDSLSLTLFVVFYRAALGCELIFMKSGHETTVSLLKKLYNNRT